MIFSPIEDNFIGYFVVSAPLGNTAMWLGWIR